MRDEGANFRANGTKSKHPKQTAPFSSIELEAIYDLDFRTCNILMLRKIKPNASQFLVVQCIHKLSKTVMHDSALES